MSGNPMLAVHDLRVAYGGLTAVHDIAFDVREGEIVALLGANGAGKSSVLRAISGMVPYRGEVCFRNQPLAGMAPEDIVAAGLVHVPEGRGIFGNLSVLENLRLATWQRRRDRPGVAADYERVFALFPRLAERKEQRAGTLSGGEQQMLAVGRALMSRGRMMLLDEPSMGLAPVLVRDIFRSLAEIHRAGTTLLLVEQNAHLSLRLATRGYVLETGRIALAGTGAELLDHPRVKEAYLGG